MFKVDNKDTNVNNKDTRGRLTLLVSLVNAFPLDSLVINLTSHEIYPSSLSTIQINKFYPSQMRHTQDQQKNPSKIADEICKLKQILLVP